MTHSPAPSRASGSLTIQFGIVSVPVSVFTGIEEKKVTRKMRTPAGNAVKMLTVDSETGEVVSRQETTHVYVMDDGTEVPLSDEEIASAMGEENGSCQVVGMYPMAELANYSVASVAQIRPATVKVGKKTTSPNNKPFVLLMQAMAAKGAIALVRYTLRGVPRLGAITPDGQMRVLYWDDEVRAARPMPEDTCSGAELALAGQLVDMMMEPKPPVLDNDAVARVEAYVAAKAQGMTPVEVAKAPEPTMDLMAALKASLAASKAS